MFGLRKAEAIRDTPEGDFILSLIPYGLFRRAALGKLAKEAMGFSPKYELIVHRPGRTRDPICTFHFADRQTAETMYHRIAQTLIQDGVYGKLFPKMIRGAGPHGIDARWMPNLKPIAESEIEEITDLEEKEFSDRLAKYVK